MSELPMLSIRSYSRTTQAHSHRWHQLVLPLQGKILIAIDQQQYQVTPGQCLVIYSGQEHAFSAEKTARFLVADLAHLPEHLEELSSPYLAINAPMVAFCQFAELQLQHQHSPQLVSSMARLFVDLLQQLPVDQPYDKRIADAIELMRQDLSTELPLSRLAEAACLSLSQFKLLFKSQTGKTAGQYLIMLRMQRAKALLANTDYPIQLIAEQVGYLDASAFSRRFLQSCGKTPSAFAGRYQDH